MAMAAATSVVTDVRQMLRPLKRLPCSSPSPSFSSYSVSIKAQEQLETL